MSFELLTVPCLSDNYAFLAHDADTKATLLVDAPESEPILSELEKKLTQIKAEMSSIKEIKEQWDKEAKAE